MRPVYLRCLAAGLAVLLALPALAQFPGGGRFGGGNDPAMLLMNKSVQEELKLTDDQKAELTKLQEKNREVMKKAFESGDKEKGREVMKAAFEDMRKEVDKVKASLKPDQTKRFKQITMQTSGIRAFADEDVRKDLKLTDKQADEIKSLVEDVAKDSAELFKDARGDREKMKEAGKKVQALSKEAMEKVNGVLTSEQKKTWTDMMGEKFEIKFEPLGFGPGGKREKDKGKKEGDK